MDKNKIVSDGQQRIKETEEYKRQVREIREVVQNKYQAELAQANLFRRWMLKLKMQREIAVG